MNAVLIIDKPSGLTSHDVVNRVRRILNQRSVGHLGTLDPMATGVLPLVTGNLTRLAQFYTSSEKCYEGVIRFGFSTDTYDAEGDPTTEPRDITLNEDELRTATVRFRGIIDQIPPPFSAKKIKGVPAYKLARKQKEVTLQAVQVEIKEFEILAVEKDRAHFRARVASGTYMRSVAHDLGHALGCGAHLDSLRRTAVAEFTLEDAHTLEELSNYRHPGRSLPSPEGKATGVEGPCVDVARALLPATASTKANSEVLHGASASTRPAEAPEALHDFFIHPRKLLPQFPSVTADESTAARIRAGRPVNLPDVSRAKLIKVFASQRELLCIASRVAGTLFHPKIVFTGPA